MMVDAGIPISVVQDILNCTRSYVYKLIRSGDLAAVANRPTLVSSQSVIQRLETRFPFLKGCRSSIDYHVRERSHV